MMPMSIALLPFGVTIGATVATIAFNPWAGWVGGPLIAAGSAHLAALTLGEAGTSAGAVIAAALIINGRLAGYSAALAPLFRHHPTWFQWLGSYFLTDQTFALAIEYPDPESAEFRVYHLATGLTLFIPWVAAISVGLTVGPVIPLSWDLWMAAPLMFTAMTTQAITDRPALVAGLTSSGVAFGLADLPSGVGLLIAISVGAVVGGLNQS
jgi:predicted branched-subunit amino acid permease